MVKFVHCNSNFLSIYVATRISLRDMVWISKLSWGRMPPDSPCHHTLKCPPSMENVLLVTVTFLVHSSTITRSTKRHHSTNKVCNSSSSFQSTTCRLITNHWQSELITKLSLILSITTDWHGTTRIVAYCTITYNLHSCACYFVDSRQCHGFT